MLPAWAAVLIALGGAAIGALAGLTGSYFTLRGAQLNIEHSEREAWRTRLVEAAQEFSEAVTRMVAHFFEIFDADDSFGAAALASEQLLAENELVAHKSIRITLLFGDDSPASIAVHESAAALGRARVLVVTPVEVGERVEALEQASELVNTADRAHDEYLRAAYEAIRPTFGRSDL